MSNDSKTVLLTQLAAALAPRDTGKQWEKAVPKRERPRNYYGYLLGSQGDRDVRDVADLTWTKASQAAWDVPTLIAKDRFIVTLNNTGADLFRVELVIAVQDAHNPRLTNALRRQAYLEPLAFIGRTVRLTQSPLVAGHRALSREQHKRRIIDNGPTWFVIDRSLTEGGPDLAAIFE